MYHIVNCVLLGSKLLWLLFRAGNLSFHSLCCDFVSIAIIYNLVIVGPLQKVRPRNGILCLGLGLNLVVLVPLRSEFIGEL